MTRTQKRQMLRRTVRAMLKEYVSEADHQDGLSFWDSFCNANEMLTDFALYLRSVNETAPERVHGYGHGAGSPPDIGSTGKVM